MKRDRALGGGGDSKRAGGDMSHPAYILKEALVVNELYQNDQKSNEHS